MRHLKYKLLFLLSLISICSLGQYPDSLLKYLEIAATKSALLKQKYTEYEAALQKVPQAGALQDPELSVGVFLKPMELVDGRQLTEASLMQMFPWFGVLRNAKDEMSLMANAKYDEFRDSKLQVFYDVQRTWYDIYKLRQNISVSEKNVEILKSIENLALIRYKTSGNASNTRQETVSPARQTGQQNSGSSGNMSGMSGNASTGSVTSGGQSSTGMQNNGSMEGSSSVTSLSDLYRINIEISDLENNIALLKDQENYVTADFNSMLNRPPLTSVFTTDTLLADSLNYSLSEISDSIKTKNPMLGMLDYEKQSYDARKKMVKGMGYPMVGFGVNYSLIGKSEMSEAVGMNGKDMVMPMVKMTLPVYRKKYRSMQKEAELLSLVSAQKYIATSNDLQTQYYQAIQMYQSARRRISLYNEQYQLASKTLDLVLRSFSTSGAYLTDVLRVRQQTLEYELNRIEAVADLNTSIALLKRLMAFSDIK
ncbi:MAG TPA: TolC family protein [Bacteroidales bacterium]|nr:TolC family protein [Bacteroidales bacterium]